MTCSECSAAVVAAGQRYCHVCGAQLPHGTTTANATNAGPLYTVGDGSDRAMSALTRQLTVDWLRTHKGRIAVYGGIAAVAAVALVAALVFVVTIVAWLATLFAPVLVALFVLYLIARPRRRRRRLMRIYRF